MQKNKLELVITPGDSQGIGPEVTEKAILRLSKPFSKHNFVLFASRFIFSKKSRLHKMKNVSFVEPPHDFSPEKQIGWNIEQAALYVKNNLRNSALITGPINKEKLRAGGYSFNGHTDLLASLCDTKNVTMVLANSFFRVALVTQHCSIKDVSSKLTKEALERVFGHCFNFCVSSLNLEKPKIAILGLNPHAGENGLLGNEEKNIICPTIEILRKKYPQANITGPHSADSFFANERGAKFKDRHHTIIAMYHDQGLIPVKLSDFKDCMNFTLGLPIIRTSVDHGTAYDIAGKNKADPSSMIYAIKNAEQFLKQRRSE